jgi:probable HAF family extracellular repeat protein
MANDVSADGAVVVGQSRGEAFRWTMSEGMQSLGSNANASAISADGFVIVGRSHGRAFRWTASTGLVLLSDAASSGASGVSADGAIIVGSLSDGEREFQWTEEGGVVDIDALAGLAEGTWASDISSDGSTIVGTSQGRAFRLRVGMAIEDLGVLDETSGTSAVSADGSVIVGYANEATFTGVQAVRWTAETGMVGLGERLPGDFFWSEAHDVSADGAVVVGQQGPPDGAFLWTENSGSRLIASILIEDYGLGESLAGWQLIAANAVSADGKTIVGWGRNPVGEYEPWIAYVPEPSGLLLLVCTIPFTWLLGRRYRNPGETAQARHS